MLAISSRYRLSACASAAIAALAVSYSPARAANIDTGVEDLQVRLDTKVGFTAAARMKGRDDGNAANPAKAGAISSDYFADKGDIYSTRFDLFSELDVRYQSDHGLRISAAAWYDPKFRDSPNVGPAGLANSPFAPSGEWPSETRRYYRSSGEFLDAFAFTWGPCRAM
jgi:hypothetical protein